MAGSRMLVLSIVATLYTRLAHCAQLRGSSAQPACLCLFDLDGTLGHGGIEEAELSNVPAAVKTFNECAEAGCELGIITGGDLDTLKPDIKAVLALSEPKQGDFSDGLSTNIFLGVPAKEKLTKIIKGDHTYCVEKGEGWNKPVAIAELPDISTFDQVILFDDNTSEAICQRETFWSGKYNQCDENAKLCDGGYWWVPAGAGSGIPMSRNRARYSDKNEGLNQCNANQAHRLLQQTDTGSFKYSSKVKTNTNLSVGLFGKVYSKASDDQFRCEAIFGCIDDPLLLPPAHQMEPSPSPSPSPSLLHSNNSTHAGPEPFPKTCDWQHENVPCNSKTDCDDWITENCLDLTPKVEGYCKPNKNCHLNVNHHSGW